KVFLLKISHIYLLAVSNRAQNVDHIHTGSNDRCLLFPILGPDGQDATLQANEKNEDKLHSS
ncbi:MAG: hypothetical protein V3R93_02905, partial [Candidatus Hydrothermarchaeaceae archaeon]